MSEITRIGVDLAKNVIQIHAVDASGKVATNRALVRYKFILWFAQLPAESLIAMEASSSAHHWGRKLVALGLNARIIAAHLVAPYQLQGKSGKVLRENLTCVIEDASNELAGMARLVIERAQSQWAELDAHIEWCDARIKAHIKQDEHAKQAMGLMGVGPVTALALIATVGDFKQFKDGEQFGAWLGLTPKQNSSGGKNNLGGITKVATCMCACC
jgi:transposase